MKIRNIAAAAAVASLATAPAIAAPTSAPVEGEMEFGGEGSGIVLGILAAIAIIAGIILIADDDDDDAVSP